MRYLTVVLLIGSLALAGCGGGGASSDITINIVSTAGLDGYVQASGTVNTSDPFMAAGDTSGPPANDTARFFVSFPLAQIPAGATILDATLIVTQTNVAGTPYTDLGLLVVDHLNYGATLEFADFGLAPLAPAFGVLSSTAVLEVKTLDVQTQVEADIAALRTRSQFRGLFGALTDGNSDNDFVNLPTAESANNKPLLRVTYTPP